MAERNRWHVLPHEDGWQVKRRNAGRAKFVTSTKQPTINRAVRIAKNNKPSQVFIHNKYGRIIEERTYGDDPEEYKG